MTASTFAKLAQQPKALRSAAVCAIGALASFFLYEIDSGPPLPQPVDHSHIDYFQSLERFREQGLPCELPAHIEESLREDGRLQELEAEVQKLSFKDPSSLKEAKKRLASYLKTLKGKALRAYQEKWVQQRRDWKIVTRGKEQAHDLDRTDLVQSLCLLFPERARLAQMLASDEPLTPEARWLAMEDLHTLCTRDFSVLYLPGTQPIGGACPVKCCRLELDRLPKVDRNQHVQACVRREIASKKERLQADVHYCYLCFNWVVGPEEWESHCQAHLQTLTSKRCGTITYCHTLVRPAYCPFCLAGMGKAGERLQSWSRDLAVPPLPIEEYQVGWVYALAKGLTAARAILDEEHEQYKSQIPHDNNSYVLGRIHGHNVVIACVPAGVDRTVSAATVANNMLRMFHAIRSHGGHWRWDPGLKQGRRHQTRRRGGQSAR